MYFMEVLYVFKKSSVSNTGNISKNFLGYGVDAGATKCAASMNITTEINAN